MSTKGSTQHEVVGYLPLRLGEEIASHVVNQGRHIPRGAIYAELAAIVPPLLPGRMQPVGELTEYSKHILSMVRVPASPRLIA